MQIISILSNQSGVLKLLSSWEMNDSTFHLSYVWWTSWPLRYPLQTGTQRNRHQWQAGQQTSSQVAPRQKPWRPRRSPASGPRGPETPAQAGCLVFPEAARPRLTWTACRLRCPDAAGPPAKKEGEKKEKRERGKSDGVRNWKMTLNVLTSKTLSSAPEALQLRCTQTTRLSDCKWRLMTERAEIPVTQTWHVELYWYTVPCTSIHTFEPL